jgi:hypothetical protein
MCTSQRELNALRQQLILLLDDEDEKAEEADDEQQEQRGGTPDVALYAHNDDDAMQLPGLKQQQQRDALGGRDVSNRAEIAGGVGGGAVQDRGGVMWEDRLGRGVSGGGGGSGVDEDDELLVMMQEDVQWVRAAMGRCVALQMLQ